MSGSYLLDTSVIVDIFAGDQQVVVRLAMADNVFVPSIAIGELAYGAMKSARVEDNLNQIKRFAGANVVISYDEETGYWYGVVKDGLRRAGHPIPENDIWIAAIALQYDLTVATKDRHFEFVPDLNVEMW